MSPTNERVNIKQQTEEKILPSTKKSPLCSKKDQPIDRYGACKNVSTKVAHPAPIKDTTSAIAIAPQAVPDDWLHRMAIKIPCFGILLAFGASFFLSTAGMLVKLTHSVHGIQVAVTRAFIQLVVYSFLIWARKLPLAPEANELLPVLGRISLGAASITCSYFALKLIPLGDATVIRFSLPIWTLIVGYLVLHESCGIMKVCAVVVSLTGVALMAKPVLCVYLAHRFLNLLHLETDAEFESSLDTFMRHTSELSQNHITAQEAREDGADDGPSIVAISSSVEFEEPADQFKGCMLALASSIFLALSLIALRMCQRTPVEVTILWLSVFSIGIGTVSLLLLGEWSLPDNFTDCLFILLNGLCGAIGQWFITSALKIEQSGVISLARTCDIQVAFLYSAFLLHEQIQTTSIIGSILVSSGVLAVVLPKWTCRQESNNNGNESRNGSVDLEADNSVPSPLRLNLEQQEMMSMAKANNKKQAVVVA